ncbi:hypothetical protein F5141DRAFT_1131638 [Pisolithus sp. B1]|nr:hypothetical protein F5141DRAFT_1131638 [Pisolithus sp. B1]
MNEMQIRRARTSFLSVTTALFMVLELWGTHYQAFKTRATYRFRIWTSSSLLSGAQQQNVPSRQFSVQQPAHTRTPHLRRGLCCCAIAQLWQQYLINALSSRQREIEGIHQNGHCEPREGRRRGDSPVITCVTCLSWCGVELLLELYSLRCSKFRKHAI